MLYQIVNARVITPFEILDACVVVKDGEFSEIAPRPLEGLPMLDARGLYMSPGFVDIHVHGGGGYTPMSGRAEDVKRMCDAHARSGTTALLPTTLAAPKHMLLSALGAIRDALPLSSRARILGAHMEGPCLNPAQAGAQAPGALITPDELCLREFTDVCPDIRMMGVAPELPGGMALGEQLRDMGICASIAHSDATYYEAAEALKRGYSDITHLYSSCSTIRRESGFRVPGVVEAGLNMDEYTVQVIADGKHLPVPLLQLIYRCKGHENIILITDGLEFAGARLDEGEVYRQLNGIDALYEDGVMKLTDRSAFAGSVATMSALVKNMRDAGAPLKHAVRMATENPAKRVSAERIGRVQAGYLADYVLFDDDVSIKFCALGGAPTKDDIGAAEVIGL